MEPLSADWRPLTAYLTERAEAVAPPTVRGDLSAITVAHVEAGLDSPARHPRVAGTMAGIERTAQHAPRRAKALQGEELECTLARSRVQVHRWPGYG